MKQKKTFSIATILLLGIAAYYGYLHLDREYDTVLEEALTEEKQKFQEKTGALEEEIEKLREKLISVSERVVPEKEIIAAFGENAQVLKKSTEINIVDIETEILAFFSYLDKKDYIQTYNLKNGTAYEFNQVIDILTKAPNDVIDEMHSLYLMIKSASYLYRTLGKKRLFLIKDILEKESHILESAMKTFYMWFKSVEKKDLLNRPSLKTQYDFASYFASTYGGRSYLLRRDSKLRILTSYYVVLTLDRANDSQLNSNGIDLRPLIKSSLDDIQSRLGLLYQSEYVTKLTKLSNKYKL